MPEPSPKSKTAKDSVIAECFRSRSGFLFRLTDVKSFKNYFTSLPCNLPAPGVSREQFVEDVPKAEFGLEISHSKVGPPCSPDDPEGYS